MKILNLTPHTITVCDTDSIPVATIKPDGTVARVSVQHKPVTFSPAPGIVCYAETVGQIVGLPAPSPDTVLLVSLAVRQAAPHRRDLLSPGELIRDGHGQPMGCKGLVGNWGNDDTTGRREP